MRQVKIKEQVTDLVTKVLNTTRFQKLREQLNMKQKKNFDESVLRGSIKDAPPTQFAAIEHSRNMVKN